MRLFVYISFLFFLNISFSQVKFEAEVSKTKLGVNENLRVDFKMNKDGDNFSPPSFNGFRVVGGPNQSVSNSWINGVRTFSKTYSYFLTPEKKGNFTIGQASIEIDGDIYKTLPVKVQVTEAVESSLSPGSPSSVVDDDIELSIEISKSNPYLNEPISVEFKLLFNPKINVTNLGEIDNPEFKNFWSQNIKIPRLEIKSTSYKGQRYNYVTWKKALLFPQKAGDLELLPLTLDVTIDVPTNRRDFFGNTIYTQTSKKVASRKRIIKVKNFPENGKPESFNGAVGNFDISLNSSKSQLKATESFQLEFKVNGNGNLKLFSLPEIIVPSSLEKYAPEFKEKINTSLSGMNGEISNVYTIVPQYQGKYPIPPIEFSFFNPKTEQYVTLYSNESIVDVLDGPTRLSESNVQASNPVSNSITSSDQFNFIKLNSNFTQIDAKNIIDSKKILFTLFLIPIIILVLAIIYFNLRNKKVSENILKSRDADLLARQYLNNAKIDMNNKDSFYASLENALFNFIKSKYLIEREDFSKDRLKSILEKDKISDNIIEDLIDIINSCELARYTPTTPEGMDQDYEKAVKVISNFDKR
ncbi:MAG: BatD protein [Flavobacteriaceae bacterium]|nr:BatD protein [Flavobacteriaceae bacterium]|tara:strand:- start:264 stop:2015 length:1752 start_codon:yes stop_codon:yes gene_type:complete